MGILLIQKLDHMKCSHSDPYNISQIDRKPYCCSIFLSFNEELYFDSGDLICQYKNKKTDNSRATLHIVLLI